MADKTYTVTSPVIYGGKRYMPGDKLKADPAHVENVADCLETAEQAKARAAEAKAAEAKAAEGDKAA